MLYALGSDGDLACMDIAKGKIRWTKNLITDFGGSVRHLGLRRVAAGRQATSSSSRPAAKKRRLIALNKENGDVVWKFPVPEGDAAAYSSIIIVDAAGHTQYVQFLAKGVVGVDAKTRQIPVALRSHDRQEPGQHRHASRRRRLRLHRHALHRRRTREALAPTATA